MEPNLLKNIFWHFSKTGKFSIITIPNIFSKDMQGGVFYKNGEQWLCCGGFARQENILSFGAWIADDMEKFINGVPAYEKYKILLFDGKQWQEVKVSKVTNAFKKVINCTDGIKAVNYDFLDVKLEDMTVERTDIVPSINPALLQTPQIILKETYEFSSVTDSPMTPRNFSFQPKCEMCAYNGFSFTEKPDYVKSVKDGMAQTIVIENDLLKIKAEDGDADYFEITVTATPFNVDFPEISKTTVIKINHDEPAVNGVVDITVKDGNLCITSETMWTKNILVSGFYDKSIKKYRYQKWFNMYDRNKVDIKIPLSVLPKQGDFTPALSRMSVNFSEFKKTVIIQPETIYGV